MTDAAIPTRQALLEGRDVLLITRPPEEVHGLVPAAPGGNRPDRPDIFLAVLADGRVLGFNGHVDLGTGIRTALAQIIAEEMDIPVARVQMVLGDTELTPDQGPTIASETIQHAAVPLRRAAAQARAMLVAEAARRLGVPPETLSVQDGVVAVPGDAAKQLAYAALVMGPGLRATLAENVAVKPVDQYRVVGQPVARVDIPAKAVGAFTYVHDVRLPGMLHGRVVRPPYLGHDSGDFVGRSLASVDESSVAHVPGLVAIVTIGDFVGVVAEREEQAIEAMRSLRVQWRPFAPTVDMGNVENAIRTHASTRRLLLEKGDVDAALAGAAKTLNRSYSWPYQMHGSIGPSCAVADHTPGQLTVWAGTQNPHLLRGDLCRLLEMQPHEVEIVRHEAAGCYGRNCADDVAGDAALLSRAVGRPVRVQLTREQEHAWEPKGAAQLCDVAGGLDAAGHPIGYDFVTRYPSNLAPMLPLLLTGIVPPVAAEVQMGDRTAVPPYAYPAMRIVAEDMVPLVRASWFRGVSALPNSFAHESFIDELAMEAGVDPVEYRLRYLPDRRAADLVRAVAERVGWEPHTKPRLRREGDIARGQGFAYAVYVHGKFPGVAAAWAAWAADVEVNLRTGDVTVGRITVGQDTGMMVNPNGVRHQIHGNVVQTTSRALMERVAFDEKSLVKSREWGGYPIMTFRQVPYVDVILMDRQAEPPLGAGESASVPGAAAIANAIFDATGVRFRSAPFTADVILAGLNGAAPPAPSHKRRWFGALAGVGALMAAGVGLMGMNRAIPAAAPVGPDVFSPAQIARGKLLAEAGDCAVCHTAAGRPAYAGGRSIETPFGIVYTTNLTSDVKTGMGAYSFDAFLRAMRAGIARDGRHLYPAFPYTAYSKMTDEDLLALYAFLTTLPPVVAETPPARMKFPFNLRPLLAGWNGLFHKPGALTANPAQSAQWNRGRYLVEAVGHCSACHTPRNLLGAERTGATMAGAMVEGWEAPPLIATLSHAPVPWTERALYDYLRHGVSAEHGAASGPMAEVVAGLANLPDSDVAAMAHYLASLAPPPPTDGVTEAAALADAAWRSAPTSDLEAARLFAGACQSCHHDGSGPPVFGANISLALNSNLHSARPDNLIRVLLDGIETPPAPALGPMPAFRDSLDNRQVAALARYLRQRFAPEQPAWDGLEATAARLRGAVSH